MHLYCSMTQIDGQIDTGSPVYDDDLNKHLKAHIITQLSFIPDDLKQNYSY